MTKFQDANIKPADGEEPIPAPKIPTRTTSRCERVWTNRMSAWTGLVARRRGRCSGPAGVEATFLRPDLNDGFAAFGAFDGVQDTEHDYSTASDDVDDFYMSPRIWIGVQGCLWGANLRYWHLRAGEGSYRSHARHERRMGWPGLRCP